MKRTRLKGGSLAGTWLVQDGDRKTIQKEVSTVENREYGFYRWFSQLKKLQRLHAVHPDLFPRVLDVDAEGDRAWFDLEYVEGSRMVSEILHEGCSDEAVDRMHAAMWRAMDRLHARRIPSGANALHLYLSQEVDQALDVCQRDEQFVAFMRHDRLWFNGEEVVPLMARREQLRGILDRLDIEPWETDTHGNITLENTLYVPDEDRIVFIDLYEENFVDNVYNEYSQVLQSCHSRYELYNEAEIEVDGPSIRCTLGPVPSLDRFDEAFQAQLRQRLSDDEQILVRWYEVTQFTRMLPFKRHVAPDRMTFFYGLASHLLEGLVRDLP